jgi:uncharacterized protein (DUF2062 family)
MSRRSWPFPLPFHSLSLFVPGRGRERAIGATLRPCVRPSRERSDPADADIPRSMERRDSRSPRQARAGTASGAAGGGAGKHAMRLPLWAMRWMHRSRLSRSRLRGSFIHTWLGDRILEKPLWKPTRESLARAWLVGFPITVMPFLPAQSLFACIAALFVRGNLLLCIALQFLSSPLTAPVHLPACYFVGELVRGKNPAMVWRHIRSTPQGSTDTGQRGLPLPWRVRHWHHWRSRGLRRDSWHLARADPSAPVGQAGRPARLRQPFRSNRKRYSRLSSRVIKADRAAAGALPAYKIRCTSARIGASMPRS